MYKVITFRCQNTQLHGMKEYEDFRVAVVCQSLREACETLKRVYGHDDWKFAYETEAHSVIDESSNPYRGR